MLVRRLAIVITYYAYDIGGVDNIVVTLLREIQIVSPIYCIYIIITVDEPLAINRQIHQQSGRVVSGLRDTEINPRII